MANARDIRALRGGRSTWEALRAAHPRTTFDLSNGDLAGLDLRNLDLVRVNFRGADLRKARLNESELVEADLSGADLTNASLYSTDLAGASITKATATGADFRYAFIGPLMLGDGKSTSAVLADGDFSRANFRYANLARARMARARLNGADMRGASLRNTDLRAAVLRGASLLDIDGHAAKLQGADLSEARLRRAYLVGAKLHGAVLAKANLYGAVLTGADLRDTDLSGAELRHAMLVGADLRGANLVRCRVYGVASWDVRLEGAKQADLVIVEPDEVEITVDNLEVAQFVHLMLRNDRLRGLIDTIATRAVLILGRFTALRLAMLNRVRAEARAHGLVPIVFDFEPPSTRDTTETVRILAGLARLIVVDLTEPQSVPHELASVIPDVAVPVQPVIETGHPPYGMFQDFKKYPWVRSIIEYSDADDLAAALAAANAFA